MSALHTALAAILVSDPEHGIEWGAIQGIEGWPQITPEFVQQQIDSGEDEDEKEQWRETLESLMGEPETLDTENTNVMSYDDDEVVVAAGGDWQAPMQVTIKLVDGRLKVTESGLAIGAFSNFEANDRFEAMIEALASA